MATPTRPFTEESAAAMSPEELMSTLERLDPECEHDDLHEPDGELAHVWREAGRRGLLD